MLSVFTCVRGKFMFSAFTGVETVKSDSIFTIVRKHYKKDQNTIYCGMDILLIHFIVFFLYKEYIFC
jgi:hypothetical protein